MQCAVQPVPQATCCTKEINRGFSAPVGGQANGDDSQDSVTGDGRQFFATPSPKESMKAARFVFAAPLRLRVGPREWRPSFILGLPPDRRQSPQIGIVGRRDSGRATGDVSRRRSLHRVLCRQFAAPRHVKPSFRASCEERRVTERIRFDS
jgi:hypothetical protein